MFFSIHICFHQAKKFWSNTDVRRNILLRDPVFKTGVCFCEEIVPPFRRLRKVGIYPVLMKDKAF